MPGMRALLRPFLILLVLGATLQLGWLQAAIGFAISQLGGPASLAGPLPPLEAMALLHRLGHAVAGLPNPWYGLALMTGGIIALVLVIGILNGLIRAILRLSGWLRDAWV